MRAPSLMSGLEGRPMCLVALAEIRSVVRHAAVGPQPGPDARAVASAIASPVGPGTASSKAAGGPGRVSGAVSGVVSGGRAPRARAPAARPSLLAGGLARAGVLAGALALSACALPGPAGERAPVGESLRPADAAAAAVPASLPRLQPSPSSPSSPSGASVPAIGPVSAGAGAATASGTAGLSGSADAPLPIAEPQADAAAEAALLDWPALVRDARLRQLIERATQDSRDLRVSALTVAKARAALGVIEANAWPVVNASAGLSASRTPAEANTSGQVSHARTASVALGVSAWELDFFGRLSSLRDSALQTWLASAQTQRTTRLSWVAELCNAWLTVGAAQQGRALAQQTLDSQWRSLQRGRQRVALGADSALTLVSTEVAVETARRDLAVWDSTLQQARNALDLLAGAPVPAELLPGTEWPATAPLALAGVPADLPSSLLLRRPDVQAAEHQLRAARADIAAARAALWPTISLTASAGTASRSLGDLFQGGAWSFAPAVKLPIFDGGAARATLRASELSGELQLATYEKTVQTAFREVADALAVRATLAQRLQAQQTLVTGYQRALALTRARVEAGADSPLLQLEAERSLQTAQQALVTLRQAELANRVTLFKVLGGGWPDGRAVPLPDAAAVRTEARG